MVKKTIKAVLVMLTIITGGIANADVFSKRCETIFDYNTSQYTKICCTPQGNCTVFTF